MIINYDTDSVPIARGSEESGQEEDQYMDLLRQAAAAALAGEEIDGDLTENIEISLTVVPPEEIRALNRDYRDKDSVTDVLSFPQYEGLEEVKIAAAESIGNDLPVFLGDVVICADRAAAQAEEFGHSFRREFIYLFTHSIFHLLGFDHMEEDEKKIMRSREERVMAAIGVER